MKENPEEAYSLRNLNRSHLGLLLHYLKPYGFHLAAAVAAMVTATAATLTAPYLTKIAIDDYIIARDLQGLQWIALLIIGVYALLWGAFFLQSYVSGWIGQRVVAAVREDLYRHLQRLDMGFFHRRKTGDIMARVTHDVNGLEEMVTGGFVHLLSDFFTFVGLVTVMLWLHWPLALVSCITIPFILSAMKFLGKRMRRAYADVQRRLAAMNADVEESLAGIRVVQALNREAVNTGRFSRLSWQNLKANLRAVSFFALLFPTMNVSRVLGESLVLLYGGWQVVEGTITLGVLMAFLAYVRRLFQPLADLSQVYNTYQSAGASLERIHQYFQLQPSITEPENPRQPEQGFRGSLAFDHVSFSYGTEPVLKDVSFRLEAGQTAAIVGPTGAGKTTLINLAARLYDPEQGSVSMDGIDIRDISLNTLRRTIALVSQQPYLFPGTVADNIRFAQPEASDAEVRRAARIVQADGFITQLPQGYDTAVGEEGVTLSGGQKQLLALARAVLVDPRILLLDEATSNLDAHTEHLIQKALEEIMADRTGIIIAHRFATLKRADHIFVLDQGEIADQGSHAQLQRRNALYRELFARQNQPAV